MGNRIGLKFEMGVDFGGMTFQYEFPATGFTIESFRDPLMNSNFVYTAAGYHRREWGRQNELRRC